MANINGTFILLRDYLSIEIATTTIPSRIEWTNERETDKTKAHKRKVSIKYYEIIMCFVCFSSLTSLASRLTCLSPNLWSRMRSKRKAKGKRTFLLILRLSAKRFSQYCGSCCGQSSNSDTSSVTIFRWKNATNFLFWNLYLDSWKCVVKKI